MQCFKCGAESRVLLTAKEGNRVYRYRECKGCGRKWSTEEIENCDPRVTTAVHRIKDERYKKRRKKGGVTPCTKVQ
jgi:transcriptional regulator NrdR family protein